jgi:thioredoxin 1
MDQATNPGRVSPPWLVIAGLLAGAGLLILMTLDMSGLFSGASTHDAKVIRLTESNWEKEVAESKIPVLVDFTAEWCGPCQVYAPTIERIATRYAGKVKVGALDIDANPMIRGGYHITKIPRVIVFAGGEPVASLEGVQSEAALANVLDKILKK